ncbi:lysM domain receptor-like kinase 4 [Trifolium pratense]|uniref:lysM domain receptor-like kinase 4 n=1 Tax=Trifolium pratense TaxID=57577 RepID=UPI001E691BEB|nr:lysM domain receptor-like kinase 4 [Trifolium pratense]
MTMHLFPFTPLFIFTLFFITNISIILGQQPYIGLGTTACPRKGDAKSIRGYTCNGETQTCQAYLTFRTQPIYSSVSTISSLLGSNPSQLAEINSVSLNETFETNKMVIVPVNCSCSGNYYQANTTYVFQNTDTYFLVANNTFEGLSTCQALMHENHNPSDIYPGRKLLVPLRCACPTKNQTEKNIKYLLSYLVNWGDSVSLISEKFGVNFKTTLVANSLTLTQATIYPFTTLLVPLFDKPSSSQIQTVSVSPPQQPSPSSSSPSSTDKTSNKTWVYVVIGVLGGVVVLALALVLYGFIFFKKGKKKNNFLANVSESTSYEAKEKPVKKEEEKLLEIIISGIAQSFKVYDFDEIKVATDDFSPSCLIKGNVYRGVINGDLAAIKKTEGDVSKEIQILNKVNHSNVIRLSGLSFNEGHWYLVYEYATNGALNEWIFSNKMNDEKKFLSWIQRIKIALDVAIGVEYLHSFNSNPYIHKDLKCSNILLDNDFKAKVSNLRLARCVQGVENDEEFVATRHIVGTRGCMAPEYLENGIVSTKIDVYAFGVLMLEMITGKEVGFILSKDGGNLFDVLSGIVGKESCDEKLKEFMDSSLEGNYPIELAMFVIEIIDHCLKKDPVDRPEMDEIVPILSRTLNSSLSWEMSVNVPMKHGHSLD